MEIKLKVYKEDGSILKECTAQTCEIYFGTVRKLMKLVTVDERDKTAQIPGVVASAWDDVTKIISECFPEITEEDWDHVKLNELLPVVLAILKDTFAEMMAIPKDPKVTGE